MPCPSPLTQVTHLSPIPCFSSDSTASQSAPGLEHRTLNAKSTTHHTHLRPLAFRRQGGGDHEKSPAYGRHDETNYDPSTFCLRGPSPFLFLYSVVRPLAILSTHNKRVHDPLFGLLFLLDLPYIATILFPFLFSFFPFNSLSF